MHYVALAQVLILLSLANGSPAIAKRIFGANYAAPVDGNIRFIDGRPLFGPSKTIRGIVVSLVVTALGAIPLGLHFWIGLLVAGTSTAGDLFSSFLRRRIGLGPSSKAAPTATADAAVRECDEKRKRGELKSFKAAAECSNPKIHSAWKEAGDPNIDLLNVWLAARLVCAEKVDKKQVTEAEYQLELAELDSRLTNEKRRRSLANVEMQLRATAVVAEAQAAQTQSAAALLQGLAALQIASRPSR